MASGTSGAACKRLCGLCNVTLIMSTKLVITGLILVTRFVVEAE